MRRHVAGQAHETLAWADAPIVGSLRPRHRGRQLAIAVAFLLGFLMGLAI